MDSLSPQLTTMLESLRSAGTRKDWSSYDGPRFVTNVITKKAGLVYERLRYTLDYKDENLIRRSATERILRRVSVFEESHNLGKALLTELVRAGYVQSDTLPEAIGGEVQNIINRYHHLSQFVRKEHVSGLWSHAATEIDQHLFPADYRQAVFQAMYESVLEYVIPRDGGHISEADFQTQIFIACRKVFLHDSNEELRLALWRELEPTWFIDAVLPEELLRGVASRYDAHAAKIETAMASSIHPKIATRLHDESIYSSLLMEVVDQYGAESQLILSDPARLAARVQDLLKAIYQSHKQKIKRSGTQAIFYILITKVLVGLAVELPYSLFIQGQLDWVPLAINVLFFPILLMFMVKTVAFPDDKNTENVVNGMVGFISGAKREAILVPVAKKNLFQKISFAIFYALLSLLTFGGIIYVLSMLNFSITSMALFLFFLVIVSFFGLHIRSKSRQWILTDTNESATSLLWYLITLPITSIGRWVSVRLSSVNIFIFFMDFVLETPLKFIFGSFDGFVTFTKEMRRDGM